MSFENFDAAKPVIKEAEVTRSAFAQEAFSGQPYINPDQTGLSATGTAYPQGFQTGMWGTGDALPNGNQTTLQRVPNNYPTFG